MDEPGVLVTWHDPPHPDEVGRLEDLAGVPLEEETLKHLTAHYDSPHKPAPRLHVRQGKYIFGAISIPHLIREEDTVHFHEVDVLITESSFVTVRKSHPESGRVFEPAVLLECYPERRGNSSGEMFYRLLEDVAEKYEELLEGLQDEIDELEAAVGLATDDRIHGRYSSLRRDLVNARRNIGPLVRALRAIEDERLDIADRIFPKDVELLVRDVRDTLERVEEAIPLVSDILSGVRDYHQSYVAQRQNVVIQNLTVVASLLLVPTLIVGVYGQNFERLPETNWALGYGWSWLLIVITTVAQLLIYKKLGWIGRKRPRPEEGQDLGRVVQRDNPSNEH